MLSSSPPKQYGEGLILTTPTLGAGNATIFLCEENNKENYRVFLPPDHSLDNNIPKSVGALSNDFLFLENSDNLLHFKTYTTITKEKWRDKSITVSGKNDFIKSKLAKFKHFEDLTEDEKKWIKCFVEMIRVSSSVFIFSANTDEFEPFHNRMDSCGWAKTLAKDMGKTLYIYDLEDRNRRSYWKSYNYTTQQYIRFSCPPCLTDVSTILGSSQLLFDKTAYKSLENLLLRWIQ